MRVAEGWWESLGEPWRVCLELAWEAYCAGSLPIASVITDSSGSVVARGRNRLYKTDAEPGQLCGYPLAHAEMNALKNFDYQRYDRRQAVLYTTTEPCPMCMGAICMTGIGAFRYASRDPWAGASHLNATDPFFQTKAIAQHGPDSEVLEDVLVALQVNRHLTTQTTPEFFERWRAVLPLGVAAGERLYASGSLRPLAQAKAPVREVMNVLANAVDEAYTEDGA